MKFKANQKIRLKKEFRDIDSLKRKIKELGVLGTASYFENLSKVDSCKINDLCENIAYKFSEFNFGCTLKDVKFSSIIPVETTIKIYHHYYPLDIFEPCELKPKIDKLLKL